MVVTDPKALEVVFVKEFRNFHDRDVSKTYKVFLMLQVMIYSS